MTYEKLERANELAEKMNNLLDIQNIMNPNNEYDHDRYDFIEILRKNYGNNTICIPADICDKIVALIGDEREKLRKEFEAL